MKPFLRPTDRARLAPVGWVSKPAGKWAGREVVVVYDPRQHQVLMVRSDPGDMTRALLGDAGFHRLAADGTQEIWMRNRPAAVEPRRTRVAAMLSRRTNEVVNIDARGL